MKKMVLKLTALVVLTGAYVLASTSNPFTQLTPRACCTSTDGSVTCCGPACSAGTATCGASQ